MIWPGALLGGAALTVLQFGAGLLLSYTPSNPLLATFAIFVGLLLWFKISGIIMLVAAAWIAVAVEGQGHPDPAAHRGRADRRRAQGAAARGAGAPAHGARGPRGTRPGIGRGAPTSPCARRRRSSTRVEAWAPALPATSKKAAKQARKAAAVSPQHPEHVRGDR